MLSFSEPIFVKILLPEEPYLTREKAMVEVPTDKGPYMILPQRAPAMFLLEDGPLKLYETVNSKPEVYFIAKGIVKIRDNGCTVLTRRVIALKEANLNDIKNEIATTETQIEKENLGETENGGFHRLKLQNDKLSFLKTVAGYLDKKTG